jgi:DNA mismatch repair protein MutL
LAPRVQILPPELASQIAAGEVVERPASAVKELIENSLDAGATRVDVRIEAGGIAHLSVADDGAGMGEGDARLALQRHATSKIRTLKDLESVRSFGFRGEALPSIASVSRFSLHTRGAESESGVEVSVEGGAPALVRPVAHPVGTTVRANDLFFNVPARRKFVRSTGTEASHVTDVVEGAALARPEVTFTLTRDGRRVREWLRAGTRDERARQAMPDEVLSLCAGERGPLRVEALLCRPERARQGTAALKLFVNGRPVRDRRVAATIAQAYGSVLERGRYPRGVVYLDLPPELVDMNVHPQKVEVRFADPRAVTDAVYRLLSKQLAAAFSLPETPRSRAASYGPALDSAAASPVPYDVRAQASPRDASNPVGTSLERGAVSFDAAHAAERAAVSVETAPLLRAGDVARETAHAPSGAPWSSLSFLAQARQTYLVCESPEGLYVVDQHAAAERVTFSRLRRDYRSRGVASQALLFPHTFQVSEAEAELISACLDQVQSVGLDVQIRGSDLVSVHAVPRLLQRASPERLVRDLLNELARTGGRGFSDAVDLALATMACHASIRAGDSLGAEEARALLRALDEADFAGHCPHGRPIVTFSSWAELERKVGRR